MATEKYFFKLLKYAAIGLAVVPLSITTHELGHFLAYVFFGAGSVQLHSVSVSADKDALSDVQKAIVNIVGPLISYLTIALAFVATKRNYAPFWVILALAAPLGRIVNFVYLYFRASGYRPKPNFDEFNFSQNLDIEPLWLSILTVLLVLTALFVFFGKAWKNGGFRELIAVIFSLGSGIFVWMLIGSLIIP